jgi:CheY-like chemotaxis protein
VFSTGYVVLLVDDEPDVLEVSKLAMKSFKVFGNRIKLHTAPSAAKALEMLRTTLSTPDGQSVVSVAFVDVVMESDQAGLELCRYIREEQRNMETQIFIRTGQPGSAPERSVIDKYNISGYFTKVEATDDKLYSLTVSGARQYEMLSTGRVIAELINAIVGAGSREEIAGILNYVVQSLPSDSTGTAHQLVDPRVCFSVDGEVIAKHPSFGDAEVADAFAALGNRSGTSLGNDGSTFASDGKRFLLTVPGTPDRAEVKYLAAVPGGEVPQTFPSQLCGLLRPLSTLWKRSSGAPVMA